MNKQEVLKLIAIYDQQINENPRDYKAVSARELLLSKIRESHVAPRISDEERIIKRMEIEARWG